ncbi:MAG: hypothetical protein WDW38_000487 [Sanguina aurantia]
MADRGRKAFPVASTVLEERWVAQCKAMHKQRLRDIKSRVDTAEPECTNILSDTSHNPKRAQLVRQFEVDLENRSLLEKLMRIKNPDTQQPSKPWLARPTCQVNGGVYFHPSSSTTCSGHINSAMASSPRSIHHASARPGSAPAPTFHAQQIYMHTLNENSKLLEAIASSKSLYSVKALGQQHSLDRVRVRAISNFKGPESARYRAASAHPTEFASSMRLRPTATGTEFASSMRLRPTATAAAVAAAVAGRAARGRLSCSNSPRDTIHEEQQLDPDCDLLDDPDNDTHTSQGSQAAGGGSEGAERGNQESDHSHSHSHEGQRNKWGGEEADEYQGQGVKDARPGTAGRGSKFLNSEFPERLELVTAYGGGLAAVRRVAAQRRAEVRVPAALSPYLATTTRVLSAQKEEEYL